MLESTQLNWVTVSNSFSFGHTVVSVTRFKDLADQIGARDPDTKLLLPGVGLVKTNLCEWFENKYTLYF